jgi:DNA-binding protein H-NS
MAETYDRLLAKIKTLQAKANRLNKKRSKAVSTVNALIRRFAIAAGELTVVGSKGRIGSAKRKVKSTAKRVKRRAKKVLPKYRGPGGATWSGRGLMPVWLREAVAKGKKREEFLIRKAKV